MGGITDALPPRTRTAQNAHAGCCLNGNRGEHTLRRRGCTSCGGRGARITVVTQGAIWAETDPGAPGDRLTGTLTVTNDGPLYQYVLSGENTNHTLAAALKLRIALRGGSDCDFPYHTVYAADTALADDLVLFSGPLTTADFIGRTASAPSRVLTTGTSETLCFSSALGLGSGNALQNLTNTVTFSMIIPDMDGDGIADLTDNCLRMSNVEQANADGDAVGDVCDICPAVATPWIVPSGDDDCDGFTSARETFVGTDPLDSCADTARGNDERGPGYNEPLSPWVTDNNDDGLTTLADVIRYGWVFGSVAPDPRYNPRYDINASNSVTLQDILLFTPFFAKRCLP